MSRPMPVRTGRALRCAIYTRKSTEEGLEQEFNSLHAQREACDAFIKSQRHEGWTVLPQHYDDGGYSGGTMERPALQQLLADIRAGKVDLLVTYKIDRLTRSLADFAKIVEIFDAKGVSFVSVTQQFNTTTSMGRLTLNVLLSFAQFERELSGERVRDKIAASKRKGMWMGGVPPLGYEVRERKLHIVAGEAETVRHIFRRYAALGSVRLLKEELDAAGIRGKRWTSAAGRSWGGKPLARGALYAMLQNRIYRGEIVHKESSYPGEHAAIVDEALWNAVQATLADNATERSTGGRARNPSLLVGLLFDGEGQPMTPTHAVKGGLRYRYYVSRPLITGSRSKPTGGLRVPSGEIEQLVTGELYDLLRDPARISASLAACLDTTSDLQRALRSAADLATGWSQLTVPQLRPKLGQIISRINVHRDHVALHLSPTGLAVQLLDGWPTHRTMAVGDEEPVVISVPVRLQRAGRGMALIIDKPARDGRAARPDPRLVKLIVRAHLLRDKLISGGDAFLSQIAREERLNRSYFVRIVQLSYLAPDITRAILDGCQPRELSIRTLIQKELPLIWPEQRSVLGFTRFAAEPLEATS
jgi:site-specific DNA recombinase